MDIKRSKNILIANPFGIGDVLFSTPLVRAFKERNPDAFIGYLCNRRAEPLLSANPDINEVFVYEKDDMKKLWGESKLSCVKEFLKLLLRIKNILNKIQKPTLSEEMYIGKALINLKKLDIKIFI